MPKYEAKFLLKKCPDVFFTAKNAFSYILKPHNKKLNKKADFTIEVKITKSHFFSSNFKYIKNLRKRKNRHRFFLVV